MTISKLLRDGVSATKWTARTILEVLLGKSTLKYAGIKIWSQFTFVGKRFIDGVNWNSYNNHYLEELKITSKKNTLLVKEHDVEIVDGKIQFVNSGAKPLLFGHQLLYETVIQLSPRQVLEVGCGAGDHLANLSILIPDVEFHGADLLWEQLESLKQRHPSNSFQLHMADLTQKICNLPRVELIYSHAVLMHISEKEGRFQTALTNIFGAAQRHVVLIENWTQHDFLQAVELYIQNNPEWKIFFDISHRDSETRVMVISKDSPGFLKQLTRYEDLTLGKDVMHH